LTLDYIGNIETHLDGIKTRSRTPCRVVPTIRILLHLIENVSCICVLPFGRKGHLPSAVKNPHRRHGLIDRDLDRRSFTGSNWSDFSVAIGKRPCPPGHMHCLKCRSPKRPAAGMVDYLPSPTGKSPRALPGLWHVHASTGRPLPPSPDSRSSSTSSRRSSAASRRRSTCGSPSAEEATVNWWLAVARAATRLMRTYIPHCKRCGRQLLRGSDWRLRHWIRC